MSAIQYGFTDENGNERLGGTLLPAPLTLLGPFTVGFDSTGLTTGVALCTLPVGAIIYDIGVVTTVAWDGTTPKLDVGTFSGTTGLFAAWTDGAPDVSDAYTPESDNDGILQATGAVTWLQAGAASVGAGGGTAFLSPTLYIGTICTLRAVVSQDGTKGGTAVGGAAGTSLVYVLAATP